MILHLAIITWSTLSFLKKKIVRKERAHKEKKFRDYRKCSPEEFRKELLD